VTASGPRRLFLVRHGDTIGQSSLRFHGRNDVALSDVGRGQIRRLIPLVADVRFAAVVCSPLSRARESAEILRAALAAPPSLEVDEELREIWFGEIEGLSEPEIAARVPAWHAEWKAGRHAGFPGGETLHGFAERVTKGIDGLLARWPEGDLLVVAHRGIVRQALFHLCGGDRSHRERYVVALGSLTIVERASGWELRALGLEG
jgi:broad specificity phosphatase PhoE